MDLIFLVLAAVLARLTFGLAAVCDRLGART